MSRWWLALALLASAATVADDEDGRSVSFSKTLEMKAEPATHHCIASASLDYFQSGPEAEIEAVVGNDDCAASSGAFIVEITVRRDGADETSKLRFPESWRRDDDAPVVISRRYPIGPDTELRRIRIRKLECTCTVTADETGSP